MLPTRAKGFLFMVLTPLAPTVVLVMGAVMPCLLLRIPVVVLPVVAHRIVAPPVQVAA